MKEFYFLTVVALLVAYLLAQKSSWPGKTCAVTNGNTNCESATTGLICLSKNSKFACDVSSYPAMKFYPPTGKYVLPFGAPCTANPPPEDRIPLNAICIAKNNVACTEGYTASGKMCLKSTGPCTKNSDCDEDAFQTCEGLTALPANAKCGCSAGSQWINNVCKLNADESCSAAESYPSKACNALSTCKGTPSKCECHPGLEKTDEGNCSILYEGDCSRGIIFYPCDEFAFLQCIDKKCVCKKSHDIWYDKNLKKCAIRAESNCTPWENKQPCVSNAKCNGSNPIVGVCKGQDQFDFDAEWLCRFHDPCTETKDCDMESLLFCNKDIMKCACPNDFNFDLKNAKCGAAQFIGIYLGIVLLGFGLFWFKAF